MTVTSDSSDLSGKLLVAMPGMGDPRFEQSVIYLCAHSPEGSMGLIVNKPAIGVSVEHLLDQLKVPDGAGRRAIRVHFGGPVENGRGFVLHSMDYNSEGSTLQVDDRFGMTGTLDILEDIAKQRGPARQILALGYAGWGAGQLEDEIRRNGWLTCDATPDVVFDTGDDDKWTAALASLGIDPLLLSATAGRA